MVAGWRGARSGSIGLAEVGDVGLDGRLRALGHGIAPHAVDETVDSDRFTFGEEQQRQDEALLGPSEVDGCPVPDARPGLPSAEKERFQADSK